MSNKSEKWFLTMKKANFDEIGEMFNISPILSRLIRNRDIITEDDINLYLNGTIEHLGDGMLLKDMDKVVDILKEKIEKQALIRVIGDYDIDGINGTFILEEGLRKLGGKVDTDIPDRMTEGYGLNTFLIDRAIKDGVDTIITCDNGIAACEEIDYGKSKGLTIIVTDHHKVPHVDKGNEKEYILPKADGIVNPQRSDCSYNFKELCGAAVAYKVIESLFKSMNKDVNEIEYLMENVAMATIGDVMDLQGENRVFVKHGLELLKKTKNLGLKALMEINEIKPKHLSTYHIGFVIGPCINASGRLDTAKKALELLKSAKQKEAMSIAKNLKELNDERRQITEQGVEDAIEKIETDNLLRDKVLVVYLENCHQSVAGIVAGRVRERYYRPVIIITPGEAQGEVKGSGRSIEAYHMFDELCKCSALLSKFGGHKVAAGLSMAKENIHLLRKMLNESCNLSEDDLIEKISIDMVLPFRYIDIKQVEEMKKLEPFGKGNETPLFAAKDVSILYPKIYGENENVLGFQVKDSDGSSLRAVYFGDAKVCLEYIKAKDKIDITFSPKINEYQGRKSVQLVVKNYK